MEGKIDILLTTYNTKPEYLKQQIDSILSQTYKNINLLISDDASTNQEIGQILKEYENKDKRITLYMQKQNLGYNKNFEFLLKQSTAGYIMFADHDDIWYPQKVEKSVEKIKEKDVDMVYVNANQINEQGTIINQDYFKYKNVPLINGKNKLAISRCIGIGCSQIITKAIKEKMLPFTDKVIAHDWLASFLANEGKGMAYIQEPLFGYRLHENNVFGGRSFQQNIGRWKQQHGKTYQSFLQYRKEKVIQKAYLDGAIMELAYTSNEENEKNLQLLIKYYESLEKANYINWHIVTYFKFLGGKNLTKKIIKEIVNFHFPILGYLIYALVKGEL